MTLRLVLESGGSVGSVFELKEGENTIGRSSRAQFQLAAGDVSRGHLCIHVSEDRATAENLSRYGTFLDEKPLEEATLLANGQKLRLGRSTVLVFQTDEPVEADAPAPQGQSEAVPEPAASCEEDDEPPSLAEVPSDSSPSYVVLSDVQSIGSDGADRIGLNPDAADATLPDDEDDIPLSGHVDFLGGKDDDEWDEPDSLPGIDRNDMLSRGSSGPGGPLSTSGRPAPVDDFAHAEEEENGPHTQMMSTRAIDYLRHRQEQRARLRTIAWLTGAAIAAAVVIGLLVRFV